MGVHNADQGLVPSDPAGEVTGLGAADLPTGPDHVSFGQRVAWASRAYGRLCVGLDPSAATLAVWDLADTPDGVERFCNRLIEAATGLCGLIKPQAAFFERHGAAGVAVLERVLLAGRQAGLITILDVKRGDIGSTMDGYAAAFLADGAPLAADAITLSPYLGFGSLRGAIDLALSSHRGVFVLAMTSNPEGVQVQGALGPDGLTVGQTVLAQVGQVNAGLAGPGSVGVVVGSTIGVLPPATAELLAQLGGPILAPGLGAQGATVADLRACFGQSYGRVIAPVSRGITKAGPNLAALRARLEDWQSQLLG